MEVLKTILFPRNELCFYFFVNSAGITLNIFRSTYTIESSRDFIRTKRYSPSISLQEATTPPCIIKFRKIDVANPPDELRSLINYQPSLDTSVQVHAKVKGDYIDTLLHALQ